MTTLERAILSSPPEKELSIRASPTLHWSIREGISSLHEPLAIEAPLAIELLYEKNGQATRRSLGITMRTPGNDEELALGLLCAEGVIVSRDDLLSSFPSDRTLHGETIATWCVELKNAPSARIQNLSRNILTTSACGLCGRDGVDTLPTKRIVRESEPALLPCSVIASLPEKLRPHQSTFFVTGGCHGAALCSHEGTVQLCREDVGRHNAVDKLIGAALLQSFSTDRKILVLSGRASFELLQKASMAGIRVVVAVGAPSSAAVDLAHASGITLIGFTRENRFNLYSHADRVALN